MSNSTMAQLAQDGLNKVTMQYLDGGKREQYNWNGVSIIVAPMTQQEEIKRLLVEAKK